MDAVVPCKHVDHAVLVLPKEKKNHNNDHCHSNLLDDLERLKVGQGFDEIENRIRTGA
jgi:hypothetical protein